MEENIVWKRLALFGLIGALIYVAHVVVGGLLWPGYNHLQQPVSDLTATGAHDRSLLLVFTWAYACCSVIFAVSLLGYFRPLHRRLLTAGLILFLGVHILSLAYGFFPEDLPGAAPSFTGTMHIVVTFAIVPFTIVFPFMVWAGLRKLSPWRGFAVYCFITGAVIFVAGGTTTVLFARKLSYFGLTERINLGALQLWMFVISWRVFFRKENEPA